MRFVYEGFTHDGERRSFTFHGIDGDKIETLFLIDVSLALFARNKILIQDAPHFCLQLLTNACEAEPDALLKLHHYTVQQEDFLPILMDRERRAKLKSLKSAPRRLMRKPSQASQIRPGRRPV